MRMKPKALNHCRAVLIQRQCQSPASHSLAEPVPYSAEQRHATLEREPDAVGSLFMHHYCEKRLRVGAALPRQSTRRQLPSVGSVRKLIPHVAQNLVINPYSVVFLNSLLMIPLVR